MRFNHLIVFSMLVEGLCFDEKVYIQSLRDKFSGDGIQKQSLVEASGGFKSEIEGHKDEGSLFLGKFTTASADELVKTIKRNFPELKGYNLIPKNYRHKDFYMLISVAESDKNKRGSD